MKGTLVSAMVSDSKRQAVEPILNKLGATTSDLIENAFDYVLATENLPAVPGIAGTHQIYYAASVRNSTLDIDWGDDAVDGNYRRLIRDGKTADYASLV